jgi:hypothetical protein
MSSNGWSNVYRDEHVLVRVGPRGTVGVWHGGIGAWRLTHVSPGDRVYQGRGHTMEVAEVQRQRSGVQ